MATTPRTLSTIHSVLGPLGWAVVVFFAINIGVLWTETGEGSWYQSLEKPAWNPPGWVFGPVWLTNSLCMTLAAWLIWKQWGFAGAKLALGLFLAQLAVAATFTPIFFAGQSIAGGAIVMLLTTPLAIAATLLMWRRRRAAGVLMLPLVAWLLYATSVAVGIWWLNR